MGNEHDDVDPEETPDRFRDPAPSEEPAEEERQLLEEEGLDLRRERGEDDPGGGTGNYPA